MSLTPRARQRLLIFGLWTGISLAYASHLYFYHSLRDGSASWTESLLESFADWYTWALLCFPVLALARRFPLRSLRNWLLHAVLCFLFSAIQVALHSTADQWFIHHTFSWEAVGHAYGTFFARTYHFGLLVYWLIVVARDVIERYKDQQLTASQLETRLAEARLQALRLQLQPHFLFNTLNTIASLMHQDVQAADRMIVRLSELLRMTLASDGEQEVPLRKELELVSMYLDIEQARFAGRLQVNIEAPPETMNALVPSFFLQPIVENSVRHGMSVSRGAGMIEICAQRDRGSLRLRITDNGSGIPPSGVQDGIGLSNTRMRLQQLYGSRYELVLKSALNSGTEVVVAIPYQERPR